MSVKSSKLFCYVAFQALIKKLEGLKIDPSLVSKIPEVSMPLFVTWHKNGDLRGCIGNLGGLNIRDGIPKYAVIAAL